jgi:hypothetical protein
MKRRYLLLLLLVGCGGADKTTPTSNVAAAPPPPASATAAPTDDSDDGQVTGGLLSTSDVSDAGSGFGFGSVFGTGSLGSMDGGQNALGAQPAAANGKLSRDVIHAVVRQSSAKMRRCFEDGLTANPKLTGKITVKFTIGNAGTVIKAEPTPDTTLPDAEVVRCVTVAFGRLVFPKPDSGQVVVAYPLVFTAD